MPKPVDTVVFDIGNVLIHWNPNFLYRKLIPDDAERDHFLTNICSMAWNIEQDRGRSWAEAIDVLSAEHPEKQELIAAYSERWEEMVPGEIPGTVKLLTTLKEADVPLYAITNFSSEKFSQTRDRFSFLADSFIDTVVSADAGLLKPDPRIYALLLDRNGLDPSQCVFIDDSAPNVEGARNSGMSAIHFTDPGALCLELRKLGLPV